MLSQQLAVKTKAVLQWSARSKRRLRPVSVARAHTLTLERSLKLSKQDRELWATGAFEGQVYPDLPVATTWKGYASYLLQQRFGNAKGLSEAHKIQQHDLHAPGPQGMTIRTVAAQAFSRVELSSKMEAACRPADQSDPLKKGPADALLFVSGSHPARQLSHKLPISNRWLSSSVDLLETAAHLKRAGDLPPQLELWATENPNVNPASRFLTKVEAGATTILTQPPFLWKAFQEWHMALESQQILEECRLIVGIPILSSVRNLQFWLELCGILRAPAARQLLEAFATAHNPDQMLSEWNISTIQQVLSLPGVAGLHVMAVTDKSRRMAMDLLRSGVLPSNIQSQR